MGGRENMMKWENIGVNSRVIYYRQFCSCSNLLPNSAVIFTEIFPND